MPSEVESAPLTVLDLFSGCGGFSYGAHAAGLKTAAAIDIDPILTSSYERNFPGAQLLRADIAGVGEPELQTLVPGGVDGIIGGAPCQAFSAIGNHDPEDPRRKLVAHFFRIVALMGPAFFVFENVQGLTFGRHVGELEMALGALPAYWTVLDPIVLDANDFGAPTRRKRLLVFGFNKSKVLAPSLARLTAPVAERVTVQDAIHDLEGARSIGASGGFARWRYGPEGPISDYAAKMRSSAGIFTGHAKTKHTASTLRRFRRLKAGEVDAVGRYPRLAWGGVCPTLRAGTGSDRGSFQAVRPIHPKKNRVITPREAARLQGFPDDFIFHPTVWHSCRMIGNSVSPIMAEVLLGRIAASLSTQPRGAMAAE